MKFVEKLTPLICALSLPILVSIVGGTGNFDSLIDGHINNGIYIALVVVFGLCSCIGAFLAITALPSVLQVLVNGFNGTVVGAIITMNIAKWADGSLSGGIAILLSVVFFITLEYIDNIKEIKSNFIEPEKGNWKKVDDICNGIAIVLALSTLIVFAVVYWVYLQPMITNELTSP